MGLLERYWSGVSRRLQIEVDSFSKLVSHNGEKGRQNELALASLLTKMLPTGVTVGTGVIIDSFGNESNQTDLIISHRGRQPALLAQTTELLHPVETVLLAIEVKTSVAERDVSDFVEKKRQHLKLRSHVQLAPPPLAFFGYGSASLPITTSGMFLKQPPEDRPDLLTIINPGIFGETDSAGEFSIGLTPRHNDSDWDYASSTEVGSVLRDNIMHPVTRIGDRTTRKVVSDPSRALLLFCAALLERLASTEATDASWINHYLTERARLGVVYGQGPDGISVQVREEIGHP